MVKVTGTSGKISAATGDTASGVVATGVVSGGELTPPPQPEIMEASTSAAFEPKMPENARLWRRLISEQYFLAGLVSKRCAVVRLACR